MRGGERVLEALADLFPRADIFTLVCDPGRISEGLRRHRIVTSWLDRIPLARRFYPDLLPLFPAAVESLDLRRYDLVITSDASLVKGVRVRPGAVHVCYCHSPPRYLWDMEEEYLRGAGVLARAAARALFPRLRRWDRSAAQGVDRFAANSEHVRRRIRRHYGRDAVVIHPPVERFDPPRPLEAGGFYLFVGQLVPYKRADLAVAAANALERELVVIGEGPEQTRLRRLAGPTVKLLGRQPDHVVRRHMASCRALLFPGEEDFGIVPVEAMLAGRPVVAYGRGGALETVADGLSGLFFDAQTPDSLADAVRLFERKERAFDGAAIRRHASRFTGEAFGERFSRLVSDTLAWRAPRCRTVTRST
jgi:glycosyltransferase involved in cell wall biosynthesis